MQYCRTVEVFKWDDLFIIICSSTIVIIYRELSAICSLSFQENLNKIKYIYYSIKFEVSAFQTVLSDHHCTRLNLVLFWLSPRSIYFLCRSRLFESLITFFLSSNQPAEVIIILCIRKIVEVSQLWVVKSFTRRTRAEKWLSRIFLKLWRLQFNTNELQSYIFNGILVFYSKFFAKVINAVDYTVRFFILYNPVNSEFSVIFRFWAERIGNVLVYYVMMCFIFLCLLTRKFY